MNIKRLIQALPKAETHVHLFGTLTSDLYFKVAQRNGIKIPFSSPEEMKESFFFKDLASFIQTYDLGASVFQTTQDFYDIMYEYLEKSASQNVKYLEIIFDPQSHKPFGVSSRTILDGLTQAIEDGEKNLGIKARLILCFVRHMSLETAQEAFDQCSDNPYVIGLGLGGIEIGFPPSLFQSLYQQGKDKALKCSAHCGEQGDWTYIREGLDLLKLDRIDHGINCEQNIELMNELKESQIPLTICPISNIKIGLFPDLKSHNIKRLLDEGLNISLHSDDPSYFDCYLNDLYERVITQFDLRLDEILTLTRNSFKGSFLPEEEKQEFYRLVATTCIDFMLQPELVLE